MAGLPAATLGIGMLNGIKRRTSRNSQPSKANGTARHRIGTVFDTPARIAVNTLTAAEIKRRGMAAIEERLRLGPVHLVKRNKPAAVVLTEDQYALLTRNRAGGAVAGLSAIQWLLRQPSVGRKPRARIDRELRAERASWS